MTIRKYIIYDKNYNYLLILIIIENIFVYGISEVKKMKLFYNKKKI